jgi:type I restriction-modification system DNA methylase subunit
VATQLSDHLLATLDKLEYTGDAGLVTNDTRLLPSARDYIWNDLKAKVGLEAAFFKDGVPLVGFTSQESPVGLTGIRQRLWNYGRVPILIATDNKSIRAYNAVSYSNDPKTASLLATARRTETASKLAEAFNRTEVESGSFASRYSKAYNRSKRVDAALLNNLQYLRRSASKADDQTKESLDALLGAALTAAYLIQRDIVAPGYLSDLTGFSDLNHILVNGRASSRRLFEGLADRFNGDVFGPIPEMINRVNENIFSQIAGLLQGDNLLTGQTSLWPYDFKVLPSDLVSSIYEQLLEDNRRVQAAYYTPRFLVNVLLDEAMPWQSSDQPRVIDLACGSGAFVTEAFRRLCYQERRRSEPPSYATLKSLLETKIFAIDKNPVAARTAIFGLYLALLEQVDERTIWESAVLPPLLGKNVIAADAFDDHPLSGEQFDRVIGNPPWRSHYMPGNAARFATSNEFPIPDKQYAAAFFWLATRMLDPNGTMALLMPSGTLLHNRGAIAEEFKSEVFGSMRVKLIVDLSAIRRKLFRKATGPAAMIVATHRNPVEEENNTDDDQVLYVAAHPRSIRSTVDALTITPEEIKSVSQKQAEARSNIWKPMLWGSRRDGELLDRLQGKFLPLAALAKDRSWTVSTGYQVGGGDSKDASHLMGMGVIEATMVEPLKLSMDAGKLRPFAHSHLHRTREAALFQAPHVLVRRTIIDGRIGAVFVDKSAVFPDGIVGIAGPETDKALLATVAAVTASDLSRYWQFMTSSMWGVERDAVSEGEFLSLPFPLPTNRQARQFLKLLESPRGSDQILTRANDMTFDLYALNASERLRIEHFVNIDLPRFSKPEALYSVAADDSWMSAYCDTLRSALENTLTTFDFETLYVRRHSYCVVAIAIRPSGADEDPAYVHSAIAIDVEALIRGLTSDNEYSTSVFAKPAGFFLDENTIYITKTADRDRWSKDAAFNDADRIFATLAFRS